MTKKSDCGRATCDSHPDQSKITGEANQRRKHGQSNSSGRQAPAKKKKTWKRYLTFLSMFHNKMKQRKTDTKAPNSFKQKKNQKRSPMLQECSNLVRVIRRTAADCFAAATASGVGEEDELPCYVQLDQVNYSVKREAFGPIYLVT